MIGLPNSSGTWTFFCIFLPMIVFYTLLMPGIIPCLTKRSHHSRYSGITGGIASWVAMLSYQVNHVPLDGMGHDHQYYWGLPFTDWPVQGAIDVAMTISLGLTVYLSVYHHIMQKDHRMRVTMPQPVAVRNFIFFISTYLIVLGIVELAWLLDSCTIDSQLEQTGMFTSIARDHAIMDVFYVF